MSRGQVYENTASGESQYEDIVLELPPRQYEILPRHTGKTATENIYDKLRRKEFILICQRKRLLLVFATIAVAVLIIIMIVMTVWYLTTNQGRKGSVILSPLPIM